MKELKNSEKQVILNVSIRFDKACFAHDALYSDSKDLAKWIISDKSLKDKVYEIAINPRKDGFKED